MLFPTAKLASVNKKGGKDMVLSDDLLDQYVKTDLFDDIHNHFRLDKEYTSIVVNLNKLHQQGKQEASEAPQQNSNNQSAIAANPPKNVQNEPLSTDDSLETAPASDIEKYLDDVNQSDQPISDVQEQPSIDTMPIDGNNTSEEDLKESEGQSETKTLPDEEQELESEPNVSSEEIPQETHVDIDNSGDDNLSTPNNEWHLVPNDDNNSKEITGEMVEMTDNKNKFIKKINNPKAKEVKFTNNNSDSLEDPIFQKIQQSIQTTEWLNQMQKIHVMTQARFDNLPLNSIPLYALTDGALEDTSADNDFALTLDASFISTCRAVVIGSGLDIAFLLKDDQTPQINIAPFDWVESNNYQEILKNGHYDYCYHDLDMDALTETIKRFSYNTLADPKYNEFLISELPILPVQNN